MSRIDDPRRDAAAPPRFPLLTRLQPSRLIEPGVRTILVGDQHAVNQHGALVGEGDASARTAGGNPA